MPNKIYHVNLVWTTQSRIVPQARELYCVFTAARHDTKGEGANSKPCWCNPILTPIRTLANKIITSSATFDLS